MIAAFAVDKGLIDKDLYSSIVLAILLSTIIAPFSLRFTIGYFNKRTMASVRMAEEQAAAGGVDAALQVCRSLLISKSLFMTNNSYKFDSLCEDWNPCWDNCLLLYQYDKSCSMGNSSSLDAGAF